jgi:hypothetical protein
LWLDKSEHTASVRAELDPILRRLKRKKVIKENEDVIADYLGRLFMHTKAQLKEEGVISDATPIEHVLTVPAIWTADACRKMQRAMAVAIEQAKFGAVENLFLVSEPEAAATYVLSQCKKGNAITVRSYWYNFWLSHIADAFLLAVARRSVSAPRRWRWYCRRHDL